MSQIWPMVSVIMSVRDGERFLKRSLDELMEQDYPRDRYEVIVVDGGSRDSTRRILQSYPWRVAHQVVLSDEVLTIPEALNAGIERASGSILVKMDVRGWPSRSFLRAAALRLEQNGEVAGIGGPIVQLGRTRQALANGWARSSVFGVGRGPYTQPEAEALTDSVQCGAYRREALERVGWFDEAMGHGEDEELNWRLRRAGYGILFTPQMRFFYFARETALALYQQYLWYGDGRVLVVRKHPGFLRLKHLAPPAWVGTLGAGAAAGVFWRWGWALAAVSALAWALGAGGAAAGIARRRGRRYFLPLLGSFLALHLGYGMGFLRGVWRYLILRRGFRYRGLARPASAGAP